MFVLEAVDWSGGGYMLGCWFGGWGYILGHWMGVRLLL